MLALLLQLWQIFYFIVSPLLLLAGLGFLLQRTLGMDMTTLTRVNFYCVIPGVIFSSLVESPLTARDSVEVSAFTLMAMGGLTALCYGVAALRGVPREMRNTLVMSSVFFNSANYGLPLQELAFRDKGTMEGQSASSLAVSLQVFVMLVQSVCTFTFGVALAAAGRADHKWRDTLRYIVRFPPIYAIVAGLVVLVLRRLLGDSAPEVAHALQPFWDAINYVKGAFIAVALCTLGAQLALVPRAKKPAPVSLAVGLRLLGGPLVGFALLHLLGVKGLVAQVLLLSTATPTAVNAMLLTLEFDNHAELSSRSVLYSMLLSPVTVTLTIFLSELPALGLLS